MIDKERLQLLRHDYRGAPLQRDMLSDNPLEQFHVWFEEALKAEVDEPNSMTLSTVDVSGSPSARVVLLKEVSQNGFVFFTNYGSRKGRDLDHNPNASLLFFWHELFRQVIIKGRAEKITREESEAYFRTRPQEACIGAWASQQSEKIENREELLSRYKMYQGKFAGGPVPLPETWGGFRVYPNSMEFWQGRESRLHDRFIYEREWDSWKISMLSP